MVAEAADPTDRLLLPRRAGGSAVTAAVTGEERIFAIGFCLTLLGVSPTRAQGTLVTYVRYR